MKSFLVFASDEVIKLICSGATCVAHAITIQSLSDGLLPRRELYAGRDLF